VRIAQRPEAAAIRIGATPGTGVVVRASPRMQVHHIARTPARWKARGHSWPSTR
jgi:hypothetical protein